MRTAKIAAVVAAPLVAAPAVAVLSASPAAAYTGFISNCYPQWNAPVQGTAYADGYTTSADTRINCDVTSLGVKVKYKDTSGNVGTSGWVTIDPNPGAGQGAVYKNLPSGYTRLASCHGWGYSSSLSLISEMDASGNMSNGCSF